MATAEQSGRVPISVSLFEPLVVVDAAEGRWYAVVSDGQTRVDVIEWPLRDQQFLADPSTVITAHFFLADDELQFLKGQGRHFAEVHVPATKVMQAHQGGIFRGWLGLQRGCRHGEISADLAAQRYEAGLFLAQNLLSPKVCCSVVDSCLSARVPERWETPLRRSVAQHSSLVTRLHQQLRTLWTQGRLVCRERQNGELTAHLTDLQVDDLAGDQKGHGDGSVPNGTGRYPGMHEKESRLQQLQADNERLTAAVSQLTARLEDSEQARISHREQLDQLTSQQLEALRSERERSESWQQQSAVLQKQLEAVRQQLNEATLGKSGADADGAGATAAKAEVLRLNQELQGRNADLRVLRAAEDERRAQVRELRSEKERLSRELMQRSDEVILLRQQLGSATTACRSSADAAGGTDAAGEVQRMRDKEALGQEQRLRQEVASLTSQLDLLQREAQRHQELHRQSEMRHAELSVTNERLGSQVSALMSQNAALEKEARDTMHGDLDELRSALRDRTSELRNQAREVAEAEARKAFSANEAEDATRRARRSEELLAEVRAQHRSQVDELSLELRRGQETFIAQGGQASRGRELRLLSEIRELEDANEQMSQQAQKQFDDWASAQDRFAAEICTFKEEHEAGGSTAAEAAALRTVNEQLRSELEVLRYAMAPGAHRGAGDPALVPTKASVPGALRLVTGRAMH